MTPKDQANALMQQFERGNVLVADCPSRQILQHVTSRWGGLVMITLLTGTHRFSVLRRRIGGVSERMLAQSLQQLESDGFVRRVSYDVVPPHVEYSLTPMGTEVAERVVTLASWIEEHLPAIMERRTERAVAAE